jgi:probable HAF family extracellular repeat protein
MGSYHLSPKILTLLKGHGIAMKITLRFLLLTICVFNFSSALQTGTAVAQGSIPRYVATDLGDLGGGEARAMSVNASGQIVGFSYLSGYTAGDRCAERAAFLYENGIMTALPSLPGTRIAFASDINDQGDVAATNYVYVPDPNCTGGCFPGNCEVQTPVLVSGGAAIDLLEDPWYTGVANDVNNKQQVVGWSRIWNLPNARTWHGFLWQKGDLKDLGTLGTDWSIATAINDDGLVVGYSQLVEGGNVQLGFRWSKGIMNALPALGLNTYSGANDVNAQGDACGWSGPGIYKSQPVLYPAAGGVVDLVGLGGTAASAYAMNGQSDVVGYSYTSGDERRHAFFYRNGQIWDLNDLLRPGSSLELMAATGINDDGLIVGYGCRDSQARPEGCIDASGKLTFARAFLLTPVPSVTDLEDLVRSLDLPRGTENSLLAKLDAALRAIEDGRTEAACGSLRAFANEVEAQRGKKITDSQADELLQMVAQIRTDLGCL